MKVILIGLIVIGLIFCDYALSETESDLDLEINGDWLSDSSFDVVKYNTLTIQAGPEDILLIEHDTGNIYYQGRLIVTDEELVNAFKHLFVSFTCPHCGRSMYEFEGE